MHRNLLLFFAISQGANLFAYLEIWILVAIQSEVVFGIFVQ